MIRIRVIVLICIVTLAESEAQTSATKIVPSSETELHVYGVGNYQAEQDDPFTFTEIDTEAIRDRLVGREPSTLLSLTPSVTQYADSGAYQGYSYIRLRGIDQTRINVTLDGVPLNEPEDQGAYFSNYPDLLNSVSGFQVIRGVGLSQNGAASYGGSIPFESYDLTSPRQLRSGFSAGSFGTRREYISYNSGLDDGKGIYLRGANLSTDGYRRNSGNESQSFFYKAGHYEYDSSWVLSGFLGRQKNDLAWLGATKDELARDRRFNSNSPEENDTFLQTMVSLQHVTRAFGPGELSTTLYYNYLKGNYDFDLNNFLGLPRNQELYNYAFQSDFVGAFSHYRLRIQDTDMVFGLHANHYDRVHTGSERTAGKLYDNIGTKNEASAFTKVEQHFGKFSLLADIQARQTTFDYNGAIALRKLDWQFINPKVGASYKLRDHNTLYYSLGRTGREPTRNDILAGNDDLAADVTGNPILGPTHAEYVVDHELGLRSQGNDARGSINLFYMDFDKEIVLNGKVGPNGLPLSDSVEKSYRSGVEGEYVFNITPKLKLIGGATYNVSRVKDRGQKFVPIITPKVLVNQGLQYVTGDITVALDTRYQSSSYIDFANSAMIGNAFVVDVSTHYQINERTRLGVHCNNLFNEKALYNGYFDGAGADRYFTLPSTNILFTVDWKL